MAHSYIQAFPTETAAFEAFTEDMPGRTTLLVDTYDTLAGVRAAVEVFRSRRPPGPLAIRLDSGDLGVLAAEARRLLDAAGLPEVRIIVSGGLDEFDLERLVARGAPIDAAGVGTRIGVAADSPSLDSAYKLVEYAGRPVRKLSTGKATLPGRKQAWRGRPIGPDILGLREEAGPPRGQPLLVQVMSGGRRLQPPDPIDELRRRCAADLASLPESARAIRSPVPPTVILSAGLRDLLKATTGPAVG
jgi:nicotinate phosphoribosyltransferase